MQEKKGFRAKKDSFMQRFSTDPVFKKKVCLLGGGGALILILVIVLVCLLTGNHRAVPPVEEAPPAEEIPTPEQSDIVTMEPVTEPEGMAEIMEQYEDVYAWLVIPGTGEIETSSGVPYHRQEDGSGGVTAADMSLPVLSHEERDHYLYRKYDGTDSKKGSLFTDSWVEGRFCNGTGMHDPVTVIYGHNQANREMLGGMMNYAMDMDFSQDEPYLMYIYQSGRRLTYRMIGAVQYSNSHILYHFNGLRTEEDFNAFFNLENGDLFQYHNGNMNFDKDHAPVYGDNVVILSVCKDGDTEHRNRNLILAVLVEDTETTHYSEMTPAERAWARPEEAAKPGISTDLSPTPKATAPTDVPPVISPNPNPTPKKSAA